MNSAINDPVFPQIAQALEPLVMTRLFQAVLLSLSGDVLTSQKVIKSCEIKNKRHKPGKSFVLSYDLILLDNQAGEKSERVIGARLCKSGCGLTELQEERAKYNKNTGLVSPVIYLPELEMLVWLFPNDRKLIHLVQILNVDNLLAHFTPMLLLLDCGSSSKVTDVQTEVLHYLPERSCMVRYIISVEVPGQSKIIQKIVYGKNYRDNRGGEVFSIMKQLANQLPKCATPLAYDANTRTLWQSHINGIPLEWSDLETGRSSRLLFSMATCLAAFQKCRIETSESYGFKEIDEQLFDTVQAAKPQDKLLAEQISDWVALLISLRDEISWPSNVAFPLHQDLHLGNFMMEGDNACLIDLDSVCLGNPLADIGSLVSYFYRNGLQAGRDIDYVDNIVAVFLEHFENAVSWRVCRSQLSWFIAAALIHEVIRRLLRQRHEQGLKHLNSYFDLSKRFGQAIVKDGQHA